MSCVFTAISCWRSNSSSTYFRGTLLNELSSCIQEGSEVYAEPDSTISPWIAINELPAGSWVTLLLKETLTSHSKQVTSKEPFLLSTLNWVPRTAMFPASVATVKRLPLATLKKASPLRSTLRFLSHLRSL